jgi:hypothetical protein
VLRDVIAAARVELRTAGCSVLHNFVRPAVRELLHEQGARLAPHAYYDVETVNVYNTAPDPTLPDDHPARWRVERGNAFVARDRIPADFVIHRLYNADAFRRFVADCFELPELHELADPLAGLCLNVVTPGRDHPWHFDTNKFTVSMLTQAAESGGVFEYCPNIRDADDERTDDVQAVLTGHGEHLVRRLPLRPGDLQLFGGRYALHRVTPVGGGTARHSVIFAYSERPGIVGSVVRTRQLFGRALPEHLAAEGRAVRGDRLLD